MGRWFPIFGATEGGLTAEGMKEWRRGVGLFLGMVLVPLGLSFSGLGTSESLFPWDGLYPWMTEGTSAGGISAYEGILPWSLAMISAPTAWKEIVDPAEVVVAVIDAGIDYSLPELSAVMWRNPGEIPDNGIDDDHNGYVDDVFGWDFVDDDSSALIGSPLNWHGTFVAGLIAAVARPLGTVGDIPRIRIMDLRFLNTEGFFYDDDWGKLVRAIGYAVDNGARIVNLSIYTKREPPARVRRAFQWARDRGVLIVGAAGNTGGRVTAFGHWPAVLAVGAVDMRGRVAPFSARGSGVALVAPGVNVASLGPGGKPKFASGTSFSAPHVAGVAALVLSLRPDLLPDELAGLLRNTARDLGPPGWDAATGAGMVDAARAVRAALMGRN